MPARPDRPRAIAVVGGTRVARPVQDAAAEVGRLLAEAGAVVVTGGREGVATAVCRGAAEAGGTTVGILPGRSREKANPWVTIPIPTGLGDTRNALVVMGADAVIAFPGVFGTLSEIAHAALAGTPVVAMPGAWELSRDGQPDDTILRVGTPKDAVALALAVAGDDGG